MSLESNFEFSLTCRLCAKQIVNDIVFPLFFSMEPEEEPPMAAIEKFTNDILHIKEDDDLPQQICNDCLKKLTILNEFLTQALLTQDTLRKYCTKKTSITNHNENIKIELFDIKSEYEEYGEYKLETSDEEIFDETLRQTFSDSSKIDTKDFNAETLSFAVFSDSRSSDTDSDKYFVDDFKEDFRFVCNICDVELKTAHKLEKHMTLDHDKKPNEKWLCDHCGQFLAKRVYCRHIKELDRNVIRSCKHCDEKFDSKRTLNQHYRSKHRNFENVEKRPLIYTCELCKRKFKSLCNMQKHQILDHNPKREQNPRYKPHACEYCGQVYGRSDHLLIHIKQVHLKQLDHKCPQCEKCYSERFKLNHHIKLVHSANKELYTCKICSKTYMNCKRFKEHVLEHSNVPHFKCILCGDMFHKMKDLKKHEGQHDEEEHLSLKLRIEAEDNS